MDAVIGLSIPEKPVQFQQYGFGRIAGLWALATLPVVLLAWLVIPRIIPFVQAPPILLYWLMYLIGMAWLSSLSLWVIRKEEGSLDWAAIRRRVWLNRLRDPRTGEQSARLFWRAVPGMLFGAALLLFAVLFLTFAFYIVHRPGLRFLEPFSLMPAYASASELASAEFTGQWWLAGLAIVSWLASAFLGEELFFRGLLLPRMAGVYGRGDWAMNALLSGLYYLFLPWVIPFRFIYAMVIARLVKRYRSSWIAPMVRSVEGVGLLAIVLIGITVSPKQLPASPPAFPWIERVPERGGLPGEGSRRNSIPQFDRSSGSPWQVDLRSSDLFGLDLRAEKENLFYSDFDTRTVWPPDDRLPSNFHPGLILEAGKNPGLGVRSLHARDITGMGVGIAIVDQILLTGHQEYSGQLKWYEEIGIPFEQPAGLHGPAVASIALGKTVGVAPEADLYYLALNDMSLFLTCSHGYAQGIRRVLEINESLPQEHKIRVISISSGWRPDLAGYYDAQAAIEEAGQAGMFVVSVSSELDFGFCLRGLGRAPLSDPDDFGSYQPGHYWERDFFSNPEAFSGCLMVPMDSRGLASMSGTEEYLFNRVGGDSWIVPYVAGVYALSAQVDPSITPEDFWSLALETGRMIEIDRYGKNYTLGPIVDPVAIVEALQSW